MTREDAFALFERMIDAAKEKLIEYTLGNELDAQEKDDKTLVTGCDKAIDIELSNIAKDQGLNVVSEEGDHTEDVVKTGNYITIDPIDGTNGYISYVNWAIDHGGIKHFMGEDLGSKTDFGLLIGIVENGKPRFGAVYNYMTKEKIMIDSQDSSALVRENNVRGYDQKIALYVGKRGVDELIKDLADDPVISVINQSALGYKSVFAIINPHEEAMAFHKVQSAGLWDVLPAAVAAKAFGAEVYDGNGDDLRLDQYVILPGKGAIVIKGDKFKFVLERVKQNFTESKL